MDVSVNIFFNFFSLRQGLPENYGPTIDILFLIIFSSHIYVLLNLFHCRNYNETDIELFL